MNNLYGILKSPNCLNVLNGNNFVAYPSLKSSKQPSIFTAKGILEYYRLIARPKEAEKLVGLSLVSVIVNEPSFKGGIIRRCELPLRLKSIDRKPQYVQACNRKKGNAVSEVLDSPMPLAHLVLEQKLNKEHKPIAEDRLKPIQKNEPTASIDEPMIVNDIKSFALLDAKFREDKERNFLNESSVMRNEEFIRDIKPAYSDSKIESCIINEQKVVGRSKSEILANMKQEKSTEMIMLPRPASSMKSTPVFGHEKFVEKRPVLSVLKFIKPGKDMYNKGRERGWQIRESYNIYKANQSQCASDVAASKAVASNHPPTKAVTSTRLLPDVQSKTAEKIRRNREAEKRIRASFKTFVERQNQGRILRALKEQKEEIE